jgi:CrcB protein
MQAVLLVGAGGALGALARYGAGILFTRAGWIAFPWSTLTVNIAGSFLIGLLAGLLAAFTPAWSEEARLFLAVGVLGGFTTFSAFSLDAVLLIERGDFLPATGYILASAVVSILALAAGLFLVRTLA